MIAAAVFNGLKEAAETEVVGEGFHEFGVRRGVVRKVEVVDDETVLHRLFTEFAGKDYGLTSALPQGFEKITLHLSLGRSNFIEFLYRQGHACGYRSDAVQGSLQGGSHSAGRQNHGKGHVVTEVDAREY